MSKPRYLDRRLVRSMARDCGMAEEDVRQMLAIEDGYSTGDVKDDQPATASFFGRILRRLGREPDDGGDRGVDGEAR